MQGTPETQKGNRRSEIKDIMPQDRMESNING